MKKLNNPPQCLRELWRKNFLNDMKKFVRSCYLEQKDLYTEFKDESGTTWKILGSMDGKDMPCENMETGEVFIWDRWKVSKLVNPEDHSRARVEIVYPVKKKERKKKAEDEKKDDNNKQLSMFDDL